MLVRACCTGQKAERRNFRLIQIEAGKVGRLAAELQTQADAQDLSVLSLLARLQVKLHERREGGREGGREAGRQGGRETGRQGGREAGRQGGREAGRQGGRDGGSEG